MSIKNILFILAAILIGCEAEQKSISNVDFLLDSGYQNLECKLKYNIEDNTYESLAEVVPRSDRFEMLLARCVNDKCDYFSLESNIMPAKILCQKFYSNNKTEYDFDQIVLTYNTKYFKDIKE